MGSMFPSRKVNALIVAASVVAGVAFWVFIIISSQEAEIGQMRDILRELNESQ
jgi:hypothetical protein